MITMHSWMFLSSYEKFREKLIASKDIVDMAHLGARAFEEIGGEVVQTAAFVLRCSNVADYSATYARLVDYAGQYVKEGAFLEKKSRYITSKRIFTKIPSLSIVYWVSKRFIDNYSYDNLEKHLNTRVGLDTSDNARFVRMWQEVNFETIGLGFSSKDTFHNDPKNKWVPHTKGGEYRKWFGNLECVLRFDETNYRILSDLGNHLPSRQFYFMEGICWSRISTTTFAVRYSPEGMVFNSGCPTAFASKDVLLYGLGLLNSKIVSYYVRAISPTINFQAGEINRIPWIYNDNRDAITDIVSKNIDISRTDWDNFETSWDFKTHPFVLYRHSVSKAAIEPDWNNQSWLLEEAYIAWEYNSRLYWEKLKENEEELNRIFINIYGLQDELTPEVEDKDVEASARRADLARDIRSFVSYAVGCMFGRYSLDEPGLAFAGGKFDMAKYKSFVPENDNIVPIGSADYFDDDIVLRFTEFVRVVYGDGTLNENLNFIADAIYPNGSGSAQERIRRYFLNDFYKDHVKIYQKRPIYWLLDSGKKDGFKALFYLHRYDKYTVARARTDYLHPLQRKYEGEIKRLDMLSASTDNTREKAAYRKEIDALQAKIDECRVYDQVVSHIAHQQIKLDLDDGVKVNYEKFQAIEVPLDNGKTKTMDLLAKI